MTLDQLAQHMPAVPKEWQLALAQGIVAVAVAFGAQLSQVQQTTLVSFSALVATLLVTGGTALRHSRGKNLAATALGPATATPELVGAVLEALQALPGPTTSRTTSKPVTRQLTAVEDAASTAAQAQAANDPTPPAPGTEVVPPVAAVDDSTPAGPEPTGS